jgi:hypothetical protein
MRLSFSDEEIVVLPSDQQSAEIWEELTIWARVVFLIRESRKENARGP